MSYVPSSERREEFLSAASSVIASAGIAKATTRRIAEAAGAPLGALHYCFQSKDQLFIETLLKGSDRLSNMFDSTLSDEHGLAGGVAMVFRRHVDWFLSEKEFELAQFDLLLWALHQKTTDPIAARVYAAYVGACARALAANAPEGTHPSAIASLARLVVAFADGLSLQHLAGASEEQIRADAELAISGLSASAEACGQPQK